MLQAFFSHAMFLCIYTIFFCQRLVASVQLQPPIPAEGQSDSTELRKVCVHFPPSVRSKKLHGTVNSQLGALAFSPARCAQPCLSLPSHSPPPSYPSSPPPPPPSSSPPFALNKETECKRVVARLVSAFLL